MWNERNKYVSSLMEFAHALDFISSVTRQEKQMTIKNKRVKEEKIDLRSLHPVILLTNFNFISRYLLQANRISCM